MSSLCPRSGFSSLRDPKLHCDLCNPHFLITIIFPVTGPGPRCQEQQQLCFIKHLPQLLSTWGWQIICLSRAHWTSKSKHMHRSKRGDYSLFDCHFWVEVNSGFSGKMGIVHIQSNQYQVHFGLYLRTATALLRVLQRYRILQYVSGFFLYQLWVGWLLFLDKNWRAWHLLTRGNENIHYS